MDVGSMSSQPQDISPRVARARSPHTASDDLNEVVGIVTRALIRYPLAYDLAFTAGGGPGTAAGGSRGDLQFVHPTEDVATSVGKDSQRHRVARTGRKIGRLVKLAREIDADLAEQRKLAEREADPTWLASSQDVLATDEELGSQLRKQRERSRRGEL